MPRSGDPLVYSTPPNYVNPPSTAWMATVADSVGLALALIVVAARCYTKFRITKSPGWEDYFSVMALVTFIIYWALNLLQRFEYGGGRHLYDIHPSMYYGYFWTGVVRGYLYILGLTLAKLSLLLFLYRIFKVDLTFRVLSWVIGLVLVIWTTASLLLCIFACKPIKASWVLSVQLDPATKCPIKAYDVLNIHGYCNIVTDFALLIMPAPLVWKLHITGKKKIGVFIVFGTGVFICIVSIVRQYINYNTNKNGDDYYNGKLRVWHTSLTYLRHLLVSLEFSFSIIVACLPVITPLLKKLSVLSTWFPRFRSRLGGSNGRQKELEMVRDQEVERGAVRHEHDPPVSWKVPAAWNEPAPQAYVGQDDVNQGSDLTLQDLRNFGDDKEKNATTAKE
ncbi:MAG: hypothetical protein LQ337_004093 [Flavoplaca oasis]|nr:MAG: hypothetical protein LQ337_004093 [Flavoplaca oasis]